MFDNIVAKEGYKRIFVAFIAFVFFVIVECTLLSFISFATFLFLIYVYRYKYIDIRALDKDKIYAPISGKITAIDVQGFKKLIYINVNLCDSHILRALESEEINTFIRRGINLPLSSMKAKRLNENATIEYKNSKMQLFSSICNNSISFPNNITLSKGEKLGTFLQGQVIVTLDEKFENLVSIGEKIESGITVLGELKK